MVTSEPGNQLTHDLVDGNDVAKLRPSFTAGWNLALRLGPPFRAGFWNRTFENGDLLATIGVLSGRHPVTIGILTDLSPRHHRHPDDPVTPSPSASRRICHPVTIGIQTDLSPRHLDERTIPSP